MGNKLYFKPKKRIMKKFVFALLVATTLVACGGNGASTEAKVDSTAVSVDTTAVKADSTVKVDSAAEVK
mgnify:CR=1 FL=1